MPERRRSVSPRRSTDKYAYSSHGHGRDYERGRHRSRSRSPYSGGRERHERGYDDDDNRRADHRNSYSRHHSHRHDRKDLMDVTRSHHYEGGSRNWVSHSSHDSLALHFESPSHRSQDGGPAHERRSPHSSDYLSDNSDESHHRRHESHSRSRSRDQHDSRSTVEAEERREKKKKRDKDMKEKKRRKDKEKRKRKGSERDDRRSALTGKKIKLRVHKNAADLERDKNRENLLQFLNSAYE